MLASGGVLNVTILVSSLVERGGANIEVVRSVPKLENDIREVRDIKYITEFDHPNAETP